MRKNSTKVLRLASDPLTWREMDATIDRAVEAICGTYDDAQVCESFLFLIDLLTNQNYDAADRECAAFRCQRSAFRYTPDFERAQEAYLNGINPGRAQLAKVS